MVGRTTLVISPAIQGKAKANELGKKRLAIAKRNYPEIKDWKLIVKPIKVVVARYR